MGRKKTSPFGLPWDAPGTHNIQSSWMIKKHHSLFFNSRVSNIESDKSQNVGLEDYNNISDRIFPHFTTPSTLVTQPMLQLRTILTELRWLQRPITQRWSFQPTSIYEMLSCIPPTQGPKKGLTDARSAVGFCLGSGLFGSYNSD